MKIQTRFIILVLLAIILWSGTLYFYKYLEKKRLVAFFQDEVLEKHFNFDKILSLKRAPFRAFVYDNTYWDEMVDFVKTKDKIWAKINIDDSLEAYDIDMVWVYGIEESLVHFKSRIQNDIFQTFPLPKDVFEKLVKERLCHFFLDTSAGLLEIRGATVHPSLDEKRATPPQGYFWAAKLWDQTYLDEIKRIVVGSQIKILSPDEKKLIKEDKIEEGVHTFYKVLFGWDGSPEKYFLVSIVSSYIQNFNRRLKRDIFVLVLFLAGIFAWFIFFMVIWIAVPLKRMYRSLKIGDLAHLEDLAKRHSELGVFAQLIERSEKQKEALKGEVDQRKKVEKELRVSEEKFRALAENSYDTIMRFDKEHRHLYVNPVVEAQTGIPPEEFIGKTHAELGFPKDLVELWEEVIQRVFDSKQAQRVEFKLPTGIWIDWLLIPEFSPKGEVKAVVTSARDITSRKDAENKLKAAYRMTYDILEKAPFGIYVVSEDGSIEYVNSAMVQIAGSNYEQFKGANVFNLPTYKEIGLAKKIKVALEGKSFMLQNIEYTSYFGKKTTIRNFEGIPFETEGAKKVLIFVEEITELKKAESALKESYHNLEEAKQKVSQYAKEMEELVKKRTEQLVFAEKMSAVGVLSAGVAHELSQPLTGINLFSQGMRRKLKKKKVSPEFLEERLLEIERQVVRMAKIIDHLRTFCRQSEMALNLCNFNEIVKNSLMLFRMQIKTANIILNEELSSELPPVHVDENMIEQVIINLLMNAKDAVKNTKEGEIIVTTACAEDKENIWVEVRDNGCGIVKENMGKIFQPFFTTKDPGRGTGLGLSVCYGIVTEHAGEFKVESEPDKGTLFRVILPIAPQHVKEDKE